MNFLRVGDFLINLDQVVSFEVMPDCVYLSIAVYDPQAGLLTLKYDGPIGEKLRAWIRDRWPISEVELFSA